MFTAFYRLPFSFPDTTMGEFPLRKARGPPSPNQLGSQPYLKRDVLPCQWFGHEAMQCVRIRLQGVDSP